MSSRLASFISSGFGSGYAPQAPGTCGTVAAAVVWIGMSWAGALSSPLTHIAFAVLIILLGMGAIRLSLSGLSAKDPQWIVIDEWAGLFVALIGPIRVAERLPGAVGIMADDVVAGAFALLGMVAARYVV